MSQTEFNHEAFLKEKLKSNPVGHTTESLHRILPDDGDENLLDDAIEKLSSQEKIKQIGNKWRWMAFN